MHKTRESTMEPTYLVQRLNAPSRGQGMLDKMENAFAFGAGYKNGGLTDDAMALVSDICRFDYMGAAEFEFGALPEAWSRMAELSSSGKLSLWSVKAGEHAPRTPMVDVYDWDDILSEEEIYVIGDGNHREEISRRICELARAECSSARDPWSAGVELHTRCLKAPTLLAGALHERLNESDVHRLPKGWLELDNGYIFGIDRRMIVDFAGLFGIPRELCENTFQETSSDETDSSQPQD